MRTLLTILAAGIALMTTVSVFAAEEQGYAHHKSLGDGLMMQDRPEAALDEYRQALRLRPEAPAALFNFAIAHYKAGNLAEAASALERLLALEPSDTEARYELGCLCLHMGRLQEAETCFLETSKDGRAAAFKTRSEKALHWMRELKAADPSDRAAIVILLTKLAALRATAQ